MSFPFNQADKTRDCGYRCLYYALKVDVPYEEWLDQFKMFDPVKTGIYFNDICQVLKYHNKEYKFTELDETGLYIIYSGIWLHADGKKHGHYLVYDHGVVYCSTKSEPYQMPLKEVVTRLEAKDIDHAYRCLRIL